MKHILITGSTRGIGLGLAKNFLRLGCKVTINGTTADGVEKCKKELKNHYPQSNAQGFQADMTKYDEVSKLWENSTDNFGPVDIFINNAGINHSKMKAWELSHEEMKKVIDVNLLGVINGSTVAFRNMLQQGYGQIYNMEGFGSDGSTRNHMTLYGTTKRAVSYFTKSLAKEAQETPILVGSLSPGMVVTDLLLRSAEGTAPGEREKTIRIFNILADEVDTVTTFLSEKILHNKENNVRIAWLTKRKIIWRFVSSIFVKREIIKR